MGCFAPDTSHQFENRYSIPAPISALERQSLYWDASLQTTFEKRYIAVSSQLSAVSLNARVLSLVARSKQ
ncbi:MAG: hypothetical protein F6J93_35610 [Oscillatoria sp. SIO1A7]|nr:hypothetical protein [Oscillatoria sp. SIO1A7]